MKYIKIISVFFLCLVCLACAAKTQKMSFVDIEGNPELIKKIVIEIVDLINQEKDVNTTINLVYEPDDVLGDNVLAELKKRGFPLSKNSGLTTTFIVNSYEVNKIYLSITIGKMILSRIFIYEAQTGVLIPESPLSKGEV
jgi:hypothetical protein